MRLSDRAAQRYHTAPRSYDRFFLAGKALWRMTRSVGYRCPCSGLDSRAVFLNLDREKCSSARMHSNVQFFRHGCHLNEEQLAR